MLTTRPPKPSWDTLLGNLLAQAGHERNVRRPIGRPPAAANQVIRFEDCRGRLLCPYFARQRSRHLLVGWPTEYNLGLLVENGRVEADVDGGLF
jgi:hypothetical protein